MKKGSIIAIIVFLALIGAAVVLAKMPAKAGPLDAFAQCLGEKGAMFYGAFWCPHCRDQKALFERSSSQLPYTECSTPDGKSQIQECVDTGINSYPTWIFADGSRVEKVMSLEDLANKTGCVLPQ